MLVPTIFSLCYLNKFLKKVNLVPAKNRRESRYWLTRSRKLFFLTAATLCLPEDPDPVTEHGVA